MRKALYFLSVTLLLSCFTAPGANAGWFRSRKKAKKQDTQQPAITPVVSMYDKVILSAKNRTTVDGAFKLHKIGEKLYLEVRNEHFGREVVLSSYLDRTGDLSMAEPGTQAMTPIRYIFEKTDSLVLLRKPTYNIHILDGDGNVRKAMEMSRSGATVMTFPIETVNLDTSAVVFDAAKLLSASNRELVDMTGKALSGDFRVSSSRPDTKFAYVERVNGYRSGVSVSSETGIKIEATGYMGFMTLDMESTVAFTAYLTLLPDERMTPRQADNRIGTGYVAFTGFSADRGTKSGYFAKRLNIKPAEGYGEGGSYDPARPVEIYVDTLFSAGWFGAIKEGFELWNPAFEQAGYRDAIKVMPYPADEDFNANDPTLKTVRFGHGLGTAVTYNTIDDPRTGEIIGFSVTVPRDYVQGLRLNAVNVIGQVDSRYTHYFLPDDAVREGLRADILRTAGLCFGLAPNYAGSYAYSPEQIRDPLFTKEKGFTASVTDGVMFNFVARPGDRERGVETVVSKPGNYDMFAVKWLYSYITGDEKPVLDKWLRDREGDPEYTYVRPQSARAPFDPRAFSKDLGNDVFASSDRLLENIKYVFANADRWLDDDRIPTDYKTLFPDHAVLKFDDIILSLCSYIGGIYIHETTEGSGMPYYEPVPAGTQRAALLKILSLCDDLSWLDGNPRLLGMAGRDKRVSRYVANNWPVRYLMLRITGRNGAMALASQISDDPYTQEQALTDLADHIFRDAKRGQEITPERLSMAGAYIDHLIASVPVLASNYEFNTSANSLMVAEPPVDPFAGMEAFRSEEAMGTITPFDYFTQPDNSALYTRKLRQTRSRLVSARSYCRSQYARDKCGYYISKIDMALKGPEK